MFTFYYTIKQEDLNYGNHVGNERALLFFQWTRESFLRQNNLSETNIGDGSGFIQVEATVQYKKQLFLDQKIEVRITKIEIKGLKIIFEYEIYTGKELAITGTATVLAYNYEEQKIKKIPAKFKEIVKKYLV
ncbi:acyl-CoA thioesterase [Fusobacterium nucleatum]|uniref:acyl-CoA thioesterase n=1 Tax=Fusobacterium TaxID=848 RepID=UPI000C1C570E|nr:MULTISPECIES: thioesterase family protein [Fusobacterium]ATV06760.1 acyl-CoA thioesterase [Fusobacterium vincentii]MDH2314571.1 thioesterase family protein [Fusobacterium nucleatum]QYR57529.1 acyl-CoA thioesterase [Fusobacterium vincentii]VTX47018.1 Thioesterase-like superfamily protein [Fusobacterium nucleatum]BET15829.1 thioesterase family protein [Fusobacterium vincentii]